MRKCANFLILFTMLFFVSCKKKCDSCQSDTPFSLSTTLSCFDTNTIQIDITCTGRTDESLLLFGATTPNFSNQFSKFNSIAVPNLGCGTTQYVDCNTDICVIAGTPVTSCSDVISALGPNYIFSVNMS